MVGVRRHGTDLRGDPRGEPVALGPCRHQGASEVHVVQLGLSRHERELQGTRLRRAPLQRHDHTFCDDAVGDEAMHELAAHRKRATHNRKESKVVYSSRAGMR